MFQMVLRVELQRVLQVVLVMQEMLENVMQLLQPLSMDSRYI